MQAAILCLAANKGLAERGKISEHISSHISITNSNTHHHRGHCEDQPPSHLPDNVDGYLVTGTKGFCTSWGMNKGQGRNSVGFSSKSKIARDFWSVNGRLRNYRVWKVPGKGSSSSCWFAWSPFAQGRWQCHKMHCYGFHLNPTP